MRAAPFRARLILAGILIAVVLHRRDDCDVDCSAQCCDQRCWGVCERDLPDVHETESRMADCACCAAGGTQQRRRQQAHIFLPHRGCRLSPASIVICRRSLEHVHPRWRTPWVAIGAYGLAGMLCALLSQAGTTVRSAYDVLVSMSIITYFIPFAFLFASMIRLQREPAAEGTIRMPGGRARRNCAGLRWSADDIADDCVCPSFRRTKSRTSRSPSQK